MIRADSSLRRATTRLRLSATLTLLWGVALALGAADVRAAGPKPLARNGARPAVEAPLPIPDAQSFCAALARRVPGVSTAQCQAAALQDSGARSVRGAPIMLRDVPGVDAPRPLTTGALGALATASAAATLSLEAHRVVTGAPGTEAAVDAASPAPTAPANALREVPPAPRRVLVLGAIHGDELTAATLALSWLATAEKAAPEEFSRRIHWRFVPALNPDGVLGLRPSRTNARGVDLNRNFPTPDWSTLAPKWWQESTRRDPRRFPGPQALSEPESRWVHDEMAAWEPDLIVSIHAPFGVLDFDGPVDPPRRIGRLWLDPVGVYPGSLGNYGGLHKGVPVLTIELAHALKPPTDPEMQAMWHDLLTWIEQRWRPRVAARGIDSTAASLR